MISFLNSTSFWSEVLDSLLTAVVYHPLVCPERIHLFIPNVTNLILTYQFFPLPSQVIEFLCTLYLKLIKEESKKVINITIQKKNCNVCHCIPWLFLLFQIKKPEIETTATPKITDKLATSTGVLFDLFGSSSN